jgi:hypothetical protein
MSNNFPREKTMKIKKRKLHKLLRSIIKSDCAGKSNDRIEKTSSHAYKIKREIDPHDDRSTNELIRGELNIPGFKKPK